MSLLYALAYCCDALLYFGVLGVLGALGGGSGRLFPVPLLLSSGCALAQLLRGKGWQKLMWLPVAAAAIASLALARTTGARLLCIAPVVYLALYLRNNKTVADYYYVAVKFRTVLIGMAALTLFLMVSQLSDWAGGLPYLFLYFALTIFLLRLLRHDDGAAKSLRFRLMNLASVTAVCAVGFAMSQPRVTAILAMGWRLFRDRALAPVASVLLYVVSGVLYGVNWLLSRILPDGGGSLEMAAPQFEMMNDLDAIVAPPDPGETAVNPVARAIVIAIGVAVVAALALLVIRLLSRQTARAGTGNADDEREALEASDADAPEPGLLRRRREPEQGVRHYYRKSLRLLRARGGRVTPTMNSLQIREDNAGVADGTALDELRAVYLPVRYGGRSAERDDVRRAQEAYERLRKAPARRG